jgi:hypothetical protein
MFTRNQIINYSLKRGCTRELTQKGMVTTPSGDVFCIATLSGDYPDTIYYHNGLLSPKEVHYCGVYSKNAPNPFAMNNHETRKNVAVTKTDGKTKFVYYFEKTSYSLDQYYFHGRYKYIKDKMIKSNKEDHEFDVLFHLMFVDRPIL